MKLKDIAAKLVPAWNLKARTLEIVGVAGIETAGPGQITFIANPKYAAAARTTQASAIIVDEKFPALNVQSCAPAIRNLLTPGSSNCFISHPAFLAGSIPQRLSIPRQRSAPMPPSVRTQSFTTTLRSAMAARFWLTWCSIPASRSATTSSPMPMFRPRELPDRQQRSAAQWRGDRRRWLRLCQRRQRRVVQDHAIGQSCD